MRTNRWTYVEPANGTFTEEVYITKTEEEILKEYYPFYKERLTKAGYDLTQFSEQDCIDEWVMTRWAWKCNV